MFFGFKKKGDDEFLVVCVIWEEVLVYVKWVFCCLFMEVEWEKVARGVDGRCWFWGDAESGE